MSELVKQEAVYTYACHSQGLSAANPQKNSRCRFGQLRAPKRCIIESRRGSHRTRRSTRGDTIGLTTFHESTQLSDKCDAKSDDIPVPRVPFDTSTSLTSDTETHSPDTHLNTLTEHKRPRPEVQGPHSDISSSAPAYCMRLENTQVLFGTKQAEISSRMGNFACERSLINEGRLQTLLAKELHYHPNNAFLYYVNPDVEDKVDAVLRNEAVHNLRFIHNTFFNLSTETFCKAVNLIDRFIVKVKVKPKYMACVATASYCVASKICYSSKDADLPAPETLVHITRCGGNSADLLRMEEILASKLSHDLDGVNTFDFLRLFADTIVSIDSLAISTEEDYSGVRIITSNKSTPSSISCNPDSCGSNLSHTNGSGGGKLQRTQLIKRLMTRLEIVLCSLEAYRFRPACLALGILVHLGVKDLVSLAGVCGVDWADVINCAVMVEELYEIYYRDPLPCHRRPLVWNLSRRTLFRIGYSSPTPLDTITEDCEPADDDEWLLPLLFEP